MKLLQSRVVLLAITSTTRLRHPLDVGGLGTPGTAARGRSTGKPFTCPGTGIACEVVQEGAHDS
jgi:hypothetical protein